jgi:hypothetical protein
VGGAQSKAILGKVIKPYLKIITKNKMPRGVVQVEQHLPRKCEAQGSIPTEKRILS